MVADKNSRTALGIVLIAAVMVALSFASVPLYRVFCQVTGWGGTTQVAETSAQKVLDRQVTVRFDANRAKGMPWAFKPEQVSQDLLVGETGLAYFRATNISDEPVIGSATFNVQPAKAGPFFMKIDCFCFEEQKLLPGETMLMPVTYYIDPEIAEERQLDEVREITLSYTFYRNDDAERREGLRGS